MVPNKEGTPPKYRVNYMFKPIPPKILGAIIFVSLVLPIDPLYAVICVYWNLVPLCFMYLRRRDVRSGLL